MANYTSKPTKKESKIPVSDPLESDDDFPDMTDEEVVEMAREDYRKCREHEADNHKQWVDDMRFGRLGEQWPKLVEQERATERRPCLTFNRLPSFQRQVINDSRQNRPSIKVYPVGDGSDQEVAEIYQGLIRNIEVASMADVAYDTAIDHAVGGGFGYYRIDVEYSCDDSFETDIVMKRVLDPLTVLGDYRSEAADSSDWDIAFVSTMKGKKAFEREYPDAETSNWGDDDGLPMYEEWFRDDEIRVAEYWYRDKVEKKLLLLSDGTVLFEEDYLDNIELYETSDIKIVKQRKAPVHRVTQYILNGSEVLEKNKWLGKYIPLVPVYGDEVCIEGKRYFLSLIFHAKGSQESYNYWRTSAVEKVALDTKSPWIGPEGFASADKNWGTANAKNHPFLEYHGGIPPFRGDASGVPAGDIQMALQATDDMKAIMGIYDASLGQRSNETSGVAINARKIEGDTATFHFIDNLSRGLRHGGRILVDLIPKTYTTPRILRVLKEDGTSENVKVNQQTELKGMPKFFDLTAGKYDVEVQTGPGFTTRRQEAAMQMVEIIRAYPALAEVAGDLLVKNLDWPGADELAKRLKSVIPGAGEDDPQIGALKQQMQQIMEQGLQQITQMQQQIVGLENQNSAMQADAKNKTQENLLKNKELDIKRLEVDLKTKEMLLRQVETGQKDIEQVNFAELGEQIRAINEQLTLMSLKALAEEKDEDGTAKIKRGKAVKLPDGSWIMEAIEASIDGEPQTVKRGKATKQADGSFIMESTENPVEE